MINSVRRGNTQSPDERAPPVVTRRAVLAAGGAVALGGLAGCSALDGLVDSASEAAIENRSASPAGFYAGEASGDAATFRSGPVDVRFVPPSLRAEDRRIDIDGWSTTTTTKAQDYNSSRSNKPSTIWVPDPHDADSDADGIDDLLDLLDIERAILVYADAAIAAIDEESSDEATATLDAFINATTKVLEKGDRCSSETCNTVTENADARKGLAEDASDAVEAGEWGSARRSMQQARRIVQGDIERIDDDLDSDGDGTPDVYRFDNLEIRGRSATIGEHFVVSLPDARVRGGGPALADELTPKRVLEYFTGERDAEGCAQTNRAVSVHRDLACRDLLTSTLDLQDGFDLDQPSDIDKNDIRRGVAVFGTEGGVVVTGATPAAEATVPMARVSSRCCIDKTTPVIIQDLESWGEETDSGEAAVSDVFVVPVAATPPDSPRPMPALFHMRRIRHDDQLLFVGGWQIDDGALYENSATLLTAAGPNHVAPVTHSVSEDGTVEIEYQDGDDILLRKRPGRTKYATVTLSREYDPEDDYLPPGAHAVCRDDGEVYCWDVQSQEALARHDTGDCNDADEDVRPSAVATALDAPILHLVGAAEASNDVKFKAGAELSKAVN